MIMLRVSNTSHELKHKMSISLQIRLFAKKIPEILKNNTKMDAGVRNVLKQIILS